MFSTLFSVYLFWILVTFTLICIVRAFGVITTVDGKYSFNADW